MQKHVTKDTGVERDKPDLAEVQRRRTRLHDQEQEGRGPDDGPDRPVSAPKRDRRLFLGKVRRRDPEVQHAPEGLPTWKVAREPALGNDVPAFACIAHKVEGPPAHVGEEHRRLIEALPEAAVIVDAEGRIRSANSAALSMVGAPSAEALGTRLIWDFVLPEDQAHTRAHARLLCEGHRINHIIQDIVRYDGQVISVEAAAVPVRYHHQPAVLVTLRERVERQRMERALTEAQTFFYGAFHLGPAALSITRLADGTFVEANEQFLRLVGFERDELIGQRAAELGFWLHLSDREEVVRRLEEEGMLHEQELELRQKCGDVRMVLASFQRIEVGGEPYILTNALDITDRKWAEAQLRRAKGEAEKVARMRAALLTNMTHEFRTPLTVILGFTSMLQRSVAVEYRRFVRLIERSGRRLLLLLDSMLDLAQLEAGTFEVERNPFNLLDVVQGVAHTLQPLAEEKGLSFSLALPPRPVYVAIDHAVLQRVLNNLVDNAIKFTEEGHITLEVGEDEEGIHLRIRDTGIGIEEVFLPHIFDEFSQESTGLERTHQGGGLGLTVSKRLVERMGGAIKVESLKDQGSVFTITFPHAAATG